MNTKIATSVDQSKKLIELGLDASTADMHWLTLSNTLQVGKSFMFKGQDCELPAWSLSSLLELMPINIKPNENACCGNLILAKDHWGYGCIYPCEIEEKSICTTAKNPLDAAFEMICWLLENKMI